jgi:HD superfamily phosphohydrolase
VITEAATDSAAMTKRTHEIRDPIHTFIHLDSDERQAVDSPAVQRLRHVQQLGMSHLVYPGATHKRFEHSLGVMELAGRVFDVITDLENVRHDSVRQMIPPRRQRGYWRTVLRMAALFHDVGHLPFSHAAERELLPDGWDHERLSLEIIGSDTMSAMWKRMTPPLRCLDIMKLAVGPKKWNKYKDAGALPTGATSFSDWEAILAEVIVGDAFGVDRMDYLLRDSHHAGVAYGRFDHHRLIDTLRILPKEYEGSQEPALGVEEGGLHSAEALVLARYFMYTQVYFHPVRKIYDVHLKDFLSSWLKGQNADARFPTTLDGYLALTDNEVMAAISKAARDGDCPGHDAARRIVEHDHFHLIYKRNPVDAEVNPDAGTAVYEAARKRLRDENVRRDARLAKSEGVDFPVLTKDRRVESSLKMSDVLLRIPPATFDFVFVEGSLVENAEKWLKDERAKIIQPKESEDTDGSPTA